MSGVAALRRFASATPATERCELCARELPDDHEHLLALERRALACSCGPCALTFDQDARADARFRRVRRRAERCPSLGLVIDDALWERLQVPIGLAFFHRTDDGQVVASYPSPAGATESLVPQDAWAALVAADPRLADLPPAVEAVLVNRARGARTAHRVSIDRCYALVGLVRARWRGIAGGDEVWRAVEAFFSALEAECPS